MKNDKRQTMQLIGVALLVAAGILIYIALSQPRIYEPVSSEISVSQAESDENIASRNTDTEETEGEATTAETAVSTTAAVTAAVRNAATVSVQVETVPADTKQATTELQVSYPLNLNTATLEELMTIDGLGEKRASAILEYRDYLGGYTEVSQIMEIQGIDSGIYAQIAGYLTV